MRYRQPRKSAQIGSVIGREFSFELIQALSGIAAKPLEQTLGELVQTGLLLARGGPPKATYTFKHALVQDAAYASLVRDERRKFHLAVAETLEKDTAGPTATEPELLARHFADAGAPDRAIDYYLKAAGRTTGRFAFAEMVSQLHKGLRQLEHLPQIGGNATARAGVTSGVGTRTHKPSRFGERGRARSI